MERFPDDWIQPGEFCWIRNGTMCVVGGIEHQGWTSGIDPQPKVNIEVVSQSGNDTVLKLLPPDPATNYLRELHEVTIKYREDVARIRKAAGLPRLFWMQGK